MINHLCRYFYYNIRRFRSPLLGPSEVVIFYCVINSIKIICQVINFANFVLSCLRREYGMRSSYQRLLECFNFQESLWNYHAHTKLLQALLWLNFHLFLFLGTYQRILYFPVVLQLKSTVSRINSVCEHDFWCGKS